MREDAALSLSDVRRGAASAMRVARRCMLDSARSGEPDSVMKHWFALLGTAAATYHMGLSNFRLRLGFPSDSVYYKRAVAVRDARRVA